MKSARELYEQYRIMPPLAEHQLRVASVAKTICGSFRGDVATDIVVTACLLHDMGNILKFDFTYFPDFLEPNGLAYWEEVKGDFKKKYGPDEHKATLAIAREIGVPRAVLACIDAVGFSKAVLNSEDASFEEKICCYADVRVDPFGVVPMAARFEEGKKRYAKHPHHAPDDVRDRYVAAFKKIEAQIFACTEIRPEDITEFSIQPSFRELGSFVVIHSSE